MKTRIDIALYNNGAEMTKIGEIIWAVDEDFSEIKAFGPIHLTKTKAFDLDLMGGLSTRSKILLSAVAGAAWQHIFDVMDVDRSWYPQLIIYVAEDIMDMHIRDIGLSQTTTTYLSLHFSTVGDLIKCIDRIIRRCHGKTVTEKYYESLTHLAHMGPKRAREIVDRFIELGIIKEEE